MSFNRENITWRNPTTGRWHMGFYAATVTGPDAEWDVCYDYTRFDQVFTGDSEDNVWDVMAQSLPNPGTTAYADEADTALIARLEAMRSDADDRQAAADRALRRYRRTGW